MQTRRVFVFHTDERVRNIIKQTLSSRRRIVFHPAETPAILLSMISMVPDCRLSAFLLEFDPDDERPLYRGVKERCPFAEVILLISASHTGDAARLVESGVVYDYLIVNPFYDVYTARIKILRALERSHLRMRILDMQQKLMEMKKGIEPAICLLTNDLCSEVKKDSSALKEGVSKVVEKKVEEKEEVSEEIDGLFGKFDNRIEEKISGFGENMVNFTTSLAGTMASDAMRTASESVSQPSVETEEEGAKEEGGVRVLVISEHSPVRDLLRLFLTSQNIDVMEESNAAESEINLLGAEQRPHVIILDMDLKDEEGFNILSQLFKSGPLKKIPVILLTKSKTKKILEKAARYGVTGIILKPFKLNTVKEKLEEALRVHEERVASPQPKKEENDPFMIRWKKGEKL